MTYLNAGFGVPVNVVVFRYYADGDREYLARTWLLDESVTASRHGTKTGGRNREEWNGQDWYVSFGEEPTRNWDDARRLGFISAGGKVGFSRTLRSLPVGARVFVCIPKLGYVGVGTVTGEAMRFDNATLEVDGVPQRMAELDLKGTYHHMRTDDDLTAESIVPVAWQQTKGRERNLAARNVRQPKCGLQTQEQVHH